MVVAESLERRALLLLDADDRMPAGDALQRLATEVSAGREAGIRIDGVDVDPSAPLALSGLRDGSTVQFGGVAAAESDEGSVDLCVTGGRGAGAVLALSIGDTTVSIGDDTGKLVLGESLNARLPSIIVTVTLDGSAYIRRIVDPRSAPSVVTIDSSPDPIDAERRAWGAGEQVRVGSTVLTIQSSAHADADLRPSVPAGHLDFNRPPRLLPPIPSSTFRLPPAPRAPARNPLPWLAAAMPAVLGVITALVFNSPGFLLLALASPLMAIGNWWMSRRSGTKSHRVAVQEHAAERAALEAEVTDSLRREQLRRRSSSPGAAELLRIATTPTRRLWERRASDADHLAIRLGLADATSRIEVEDQSEPEHRRRSSRRAVSVPVTVSLKEAGVMGIAGPGDWPRNRARWIVGQLGVLQSPRDVRIVVLAASETIDAWSWAAWLPHLRPADGQDPIAFLGTSADTLGARVAEISAVIAERQAVLADSSTRNTLFTPDLVVVLDGARRLRSLPGVVGILRDGPSVGVHVICLDSDEQQLPEECTAVALARPSGGMLLRRQNADDIGTILVDEIVPEWFEPVARGTAPIRDVTAGTDEGLLPDSARLVEVLGIEDLEAQAVSARWSSGRGTTEAVIGLSIDGPFALDLVRDGPHALVAGTTGSGKSEFLQTIVASLAVVNSPQTMNFVLVDYKGGAAFSQAELLPHTVGMVTDLDTHLVQRALESLRAELTYREHVLSAASAKDLEDYVDAQRRGHVGPTLPRLVIVIDEFAAMAKELPDFVSGLVNIAQRGRSLGIHLILATQRPSGVISPEIRANTNLRVALRMTDKSESSDVIESGDAAQITKSQPGRAYARLGHASLIPFQTARVGGRRLTRRDVVEIEPPFLARIAPDTLGGPAPRRPVVARRVDDDTDLSAIVSTLQEAARVGDFPVPRRPWLPALPPRVSLGDLDSTAGTGIPWGLEDEPAAQRQHNATIDLDDFDHMYIVGAPGSGRSGALRTIAVSTAMRYSPADAHIYAIDAGSGAMTVLDELPHTGAVVPRSQPERATRLLRKLKAELGRRQEVLGSGSHANITEQREHAPVDERLPHVLLLLDRWEGFTSTLGELDGGSLIDLIQELLRDGAAAGIHLVIAGDRSLLTSRMSVLTDDMLVLRLTDRFDYGMAGIDHRSIPTEITAGRGFRSGSAREVQVAMLGTDPSGRGQTAETRRIAADITSRTPLVPGRGPFRVDDLPSSIDIDGAYAYAGREASQPMWALLGVGGDELTAVGIDLSVASPAFLVAGPARSGRSTLLSVMAESLLRGGTELVILAPRTSPLRDLDGRDGVRAVITSSEPTEEELAPHLEPDGVPVVLIVDDGELVTDSPAKAWLRSFLRTASDSRRALILGGDVSQVAGGFSGWQVDVKKYRHGALLSPQAPLDGDLIGVRLPRSSVTSQVVPGRSLVHLGTGELQSLLVPTVPRVVAAAE